MKELFRKFKRRSKSPTYRYYIVENSFVARIERVGQSLRAERLMDNGEWQAYRDVWDVSTNGRLLASEEAALAEHADILELRRADR